MSEELTPEEQRKIVEHMKADKEFMDGVKRGMEDVKAGRVRPWSEIKAELGIEEG